MQKNREKNDTKKLSQLSNNRKNIKINKKYELAGFIDILLGEINTFYKVALTKKGILNLFDNNLNHDGLLIHKNHYTSLFKSQYINTVIWFIDTVKYFFEVLINDLYHKKIQEKIKQENNKETKHRNKVINEFNNSDISKNKEIKELLTKSLKTLNYKMKFNMKCEYIITDLKENVNKEGKILSNIFKHYNSLKVDRNKKFAHKNNDSNDIKVYVEQIPMMLYTILIISNSIFEQKKKKDIKDKIYSIIDDSEKNGINLISADGNRFKEQFNHLINNF